MKVCMLLSVSNRVYHYKISMLSSLCKCFKSVDKESIDRLDRL